MDLPGADLVGEVQSMRQLVGADRPLDVDRLGAKERRVEMVEGERLRLPAEPEGVGPQDRCSDALRLLLAQTLHSRVNEGPFATVEPVPGGRGRGRAGGERLQRRDEEGVGEADVVRDEQRRVDDTPHRPDRPLVLGAVQRQQSSGERRCVGEGVVGQQHPWVERPAKLARGPAARTVGQRVGHEPADHGPVGGPGGVESEGQHGGDVRDEVLAAGGDHELRLAVGTLGFQPVPRLDRHGRERRDAGGEAQAGNPQLDRRPVERKPLV